MCFVNSVRVFSCFKGGCFTLHGNYATCWVTQFSEDWIVQSPEIVQPFSVTKLRVLPPIQMFQFRFTDRQFGQFSFVTGRRRRFPEYTEKIKTLSWKYLLPKCSPPTPPVFSLVRCRCNFPFNQKLGELSILPETGVSCCFRCSEMHTLAFLNCFCYASLIAPNVRARSKDDKQENVLIHGHVHSAFGCYYSR